MTEHRRYSLIDAIRGIAVVNMVVYHLCYDIFCAFGVWSSFYRAVPVIIWERLICSTFIIISGISLHFTRHGFRRGLIVTLCGIVTTVVTVIFTPDQSIFFGVLTNASHMPSNFPGVFCISSTIAPSWFDWKHVTQTPASSALFEINPSSAL